MKSSAVSAALEARAVRRAQRRVAGDRDERADLPIARRLDLLGEAGGGQLPVDLGRLAHAARPPPEADALAAPRRPARVGAPARGLGEHGAPGLVQVPGKNV